MADETTSGSGGIGKLKAFVKKNPTLSAVVGAVGVYFGWKQLKKNSEPEVEVVPEGYEGPLYPTNELSHEGVDEEINRVAEELRVEQEEREREERRIEEEHSEEHIENEQTSPETPPVEYPGSNEPPVEEVGPIETSPGGITIHGKFFAGATKSHIAKSGQTEGGKKYIEYTITFPGRTEHWQYFTATGNWRQVTTQGKPVGGPVGGPVKNPPPGNGGGGGGGQPPQHNPQHPDAVNTGNRCVNGGVGGHTAPKGYHLFCENGWIWRAPDKVGVGPGKPLPTPAPKPAPPPPPKPPSCPQGTIDNIHHARDEVNRLQNEINQLNQWIGEHPRAKQRGEWEANKSHKQGERDHWKQVVDNGRSQPGCGNV